MKLFKSTFMTLLLGAVTLVAPLTTFAAEMEEAQEACAEANAAYAAVAAAALLVPAGIVAIRRRLRG